MKENSLLKKIITCFVAGFTTIALILVLGNSGTLLWFPPIVVFTLVGTCFLCSLIYPFIWQYLERKQKISSPKTYGFLNAVIRYTIAFNLAGFGWKKLLGLQFVVPASIAKQPMNQQSGEWLTWFYFGYSHTFGVLLALVQIIGSYFLLFRKTLLVASIALFAFMLNLTLLNIFYHMNAGALIQSVFLTIGIMYLVLIDFKRLKTLFSTTPNITSINISSPFTKNLLRLSAILLSLLFTIYLKSVMN